MRMRELLLVLVPLAIAFYISLHPDQIVVFVRWVERLIVVTPVGMLFPR